ncbi:MAG TPA: energy transducer TonB [Sphingobium sp.]
MRGSIAIIAFAMVTTAVPAVAQKGGVPEDYPLAALRNRAQGDVEVKFDVDGQGRAENCVVTKSSGSADLDGATCSLVIRRYRAAADSKGNPPPSTQTITIHWRLPS